MRWKGDEFSGPDIWLGAPGTLRSGSGMAGGFREAAWQTHLGVWGLGLLAFSFLDWPIRHGLTQTLNTKP